MGDVLTFPGIECASVRPRSMRVADLPEGAKALVVIREEARYAVIMRPALSDDERMARQTFTTAEEALAFAWQMSAMFPLLYQLVLDESGRRSLDELLGTGQPEGGQA